MGRSQDCMGLRGTPRISISITAIFPQQPTCLPTEDKKDVIHIYNGILLNNKRDEIVSFHRYG